jgi:hypothetical protein
MDRQDKEIERLRQENALLKSNATTTGPSNKQLLSDRGLKLIDGGRRLISEISEKPAVSDAHTAKISENEG